MRAYQIPDPIEVAMDDALREYGMGELNERVLEDLCDDPLSAAELAMAVVDALDADEELPYRMKLALSRASVHIASIRGVIQQAIVDRAEQILEES